MSNAAEQTQLPQSPIAAPATKKKGSWKRKLFGFLALCAVAAGTGYFAYDSYLYVSTDNAMVQAQTTLLSSRVAGIITKAAVQENEKVTAGQTLVELKAEDYQNLVDQTQSDMDSLAAQLKGAQANYERTANLLKKGASTQERLDAVESLYLSLQKKLASAQSQVSQAKLNYGYTRITAPTDGKVGRRSFEVGMLASPGQPLIGFVSGNERWVVANLKETDMDHITEGKKVQVKVDAISGRVFDGLVESISPTTGATFSLLPPDNATGNFTKVVQRIPVRIKLLDLTEKDIDRLQSGLSAEVKVRIR